MLFTTIESAPTLSRTERRRVARSGPSAVLVRTGYGSLLTTAGFASIERRDITDAYRSTQQAWLNAMRRRSGEIGAAMGQAAFEERLTDRSRAIAAIDDGLLRRSQYLARRPIRQDLRLSPRHSVRDNMDGAMQRARRCNP